MDMLEMSFTRTVKHNYCQNIFLQFPMLCVATTIFAGGSLAIWNLLSAVEIMDIDSLCWMSVASLPVPLSHASLSLIKSTFLGGKDVI